MTAADFRASLVSLGLGQYHDRFLAEAFDSWPVLCAITEKDLDALNVRLGHRRVLQRAILEYNQSATTPRSALDAVPPVLPLGSPTITSPLGVPILSGPAVPRSPQHKRKYTRHPKEDQNAPKPPPTGYVLFSNFVRKQLKDEKYEFPMIAKIVGNKWRALNEAEKDTFLEEARVLKAQYSREFDAYKLTKDYQEYQAYLVDFKRKNPRGGNKRPYPDDDETDEYGMSCRTGSSTSDEMETASVCLTESSSSRSETTLPPLECTTGIRSTATPLEPIMSPCAPASHFAGARLLPLTYVSSPDTDQFRRLPDLSTRQLPPLLPYRL